MCSIYYFFSCFGYCWFPHYFKRRTLRRKYGLQEDPNCPDCPATCFCAPCAICQEARFLKRQENERSNAYVASDVARHNMPAVVQPATHRE
ncbi:hypothetical protein I4U23_004071 [Adineta vaga]|nr:hypothetical protein I4U23_004071 [Adineta vaga]